MSTATQPSYQQPQWQIQDLPCYVTRTNSSGRITNTTSNESASAATNWVTNGDETEDRIRNTMANNRTIDDEYETNWGPGGDINVKVNIYNLSHHLRCIGDEARKDESTREEVVSLLEGKIKSFTIQTSSVLKPGYNDCRGEIEGTIQAMLKREMKEQAQAMHIKSIKETEETANNWLKGTLKDSVKSKLNLYNLETYLSKIAISAKDDDESEKKRKAIQQVLLCGQRTIEMNFKDSLRLKEGYRRIKKDEDDEIALTFPDNEEKGQKEIQIKRIKKLSNLAKKWYIDSGFSEEDWNKSMKSTIDEIKQSQSHTNNKEGVDRTAILRSSNLDHFLQRHSSMAKDPKILKMVSDVYSGKGHREVTFESTQEASALTRAAETSLQEQQALRNKRDEKGLQEYSKMKRDSFDIYLKEWQKKAGLDFEDWANLSEGSTTSDVRPKTGDSSKSPDDRTVSSDQLAATKAALRKRYGRQGVTEKAEDSLASKRKWGNSGADANPTYLDRLTGSHQSLGSGSGAAGRLTTTSPTVSAAA
ncbi:uncharacterized protein I206_104332 [Kwoniella pini CBS 10737]|uniref:Uncharacterized protein n=1 Tax=Kwoniella pini CBS 10737 TaxID=1296096 RepID=A0A1B9I284_9TREE|nr:uncharacterized protein I206_04090 [Kwoniella pini CBS 10737]OCF49568.1 hypothetical protein I206_04090 [Kwoniella pini CBS 10737]